MIRYPINELANIGTVNSFAEGEYLCNEGVPGSDMFIIIKGRVESSMQSGNDEQICLQELTEGDFVGELSIFDGQPYESTCRALEDTLCVSISKSNLWALFTGFPEIASSLMAKTAGRVRSLTEIFYKSRVVKQETHVTPFTLEKPFKEHDSTDVKWAPAKYLIPTVSPCPVCGFQNTFQNLRMNTVCCTQIMPNQRRVYLGFDILWHYIWKCKSCGYSNYYLDFFKTPQTNKLQTLKLVTMQRKYLENIHTRFACDDLILSYYKAIHFNECMNPNGAVLQAKLWRCLCWLYSDLEDLEMANYTREKAISSYLYVYSENHKHEISSEATQQFAMALAELYMEKGEFGTAIPYYKEAAGGDGKLIARQARERIEQLEG